MATPIINSQMDTINSTLDTLEDDLVALRPLIKELKTTLDATLFTESGSGAVASFDDGANGVPVRSLSVAITPIQTGTGDPAPDNIRPITGYSEAKVTVAGLNIFDVDNADWKNQYLLNSTGAEEANNNYKYTQAYTKVLPSTTYAVQMNKTTTTASALTVCQYDANKTFIKRTVAITATSGTGIKNGLFTTDASVKYIRFSAPYNSSTTGDGSYNFMLEEGDTPSTYEAFSGNTYIIDLDGTRYGGTLNVLTGVLTLTHYGVDGGDLAWTKVENNAYRNFNVGTSPLAKYDNLVSTVISSNYKSAAADSGSGASADNYAYIRSSGALCVKDTSKAALTAAEFQTAMTGVTFVYELDSPQTIQLTPTEVKTLLGENNIWADCGDITEITIRCDTALYLQKLVG